MTMATDHQALMTAMSYRMKSLLILYCRLSSKRAGKFISSRPINTSNIGIGTYKYVYQDTYRRHF